MATLPEVSELNTDELTNDTVMPSKTYKVDWENGRIRGTVDELDACIQFIRKVLDTDKYAYCIYDWYYGNDLKDLVGKPVEFVEAEIPRILDEALLVDARIKSIDNYEFTRKGLDTLEVSCTVHTQFGDVDVETEVGL